MRKFCFYYYALLILLVVAANQAMAGTIDFIVEQLPSNHPQNEPFYIAANLNGWNTANPRYQFKLNENNQWQVSVPMNKVGDKIQFKVTRGSWQQVELDKDKFDIENRTYEYRGHSYKEFIQIHYWKDLTESKGRPSTASGHIDILARKLKFNGVYRTVRVWLPPQYMSQPQREFPVLYMFDGQNLFDNATASVGMEWQLDEMMAARVKDDNKAMIIVGIDSNERCERFIEYTAWHWRTKDCGEIEGLGAYYSAFMVNQVRLYIENNYRVIKDRASRFIGGSSLGGYMAVFTAVSYQNTFSKVFGLSNAVVDEYTGDKLREYIQQVKQQNQMKFYLDIGDQEAVTQTADSKYLIEGNKSLVKALTKGGFNREQIQFKVIKGGVHDENSWSQRLPAIFDWLNI